MDRMSAPLGNVTLTTVPSVGTKQSVLLSRLALSATNLPSLTLANDEPNRHAPLWIDQTAAAPLFTSAASLWLTAYNAAGSVFVNENWSNFPPFKPS